MGRMQTRTAIRLRAGENKGSVVLRRPGTPLILCDLHDISEMGCRCIAQIRVNDWSDGEKWRILFRTGEAFQAEIAFDPYIPHIHLAAEIRSSQALSERGYELGIAFIDLQPEQRQLLNKAMIGIATEKLRLSKSVLNAEDSSAGGEPAQTEAPPAPMRSRISAFTNRRERPAIDLESGERKAVQTGPDYDMRQGKHEPKLGEVLSRTGLLSRGTVASAVFAAREHGVKLGEYLVHEGVLTPLQLLEARSVQTGLAYVDFEAHAIPIGLLNLFPIDMLKSFECVPFEVDDERVRIACANPIPKNDLDRLEQFCGKRIEIYLCREELPAQFLIGAASDLDPQRRLHPRFKVSMPATFQCCTPEGPPLFDAAFPGRIIDISEGGMRVLGPVILGFNPESLAPDKLKLIVTVGALPRNIVAFCETRHVRYTRNNSGYAGCVYGLKLDSISPEDRDILLGMLERITRSLPASQDETIDVAVATDEHVLHAIH